MINRHITKTVEYVIQHFPCAILTGPRQVGKTTLLSSVFIQKGFSYVSLDNTADRLLAKNDPRSFLAMHPFPLIIDEAQKAVELFPEIEFLINEQRRLKGNKSANGMFILSGSSRRNLLERAQESLAGRAAFIDMQCLSVNEIYNRTDSCFSFDLNSLSTHLKEKTLSKDEILHLILKGQLPGLYDDPNLQCPLFYSSYINTYLEKDIKDEIQTVDDLKFYNFLVLIASLTGQELVYENIAKEIGVSGATIKTWVSVLLKTGVIYLLQPYYEDSWTKRIVKRPKIYFYDTGIVSYLLGIDSIETLDKSFLKGRLFETLVLNEIRKSFLNAGYDIKIYYYRDNNQNEVDFVVIKDGVMHCIECKLGIEHSLKDVSSFKLLDDTKYQKGQCAIIDSGEQISALSENILVIPFSAI